MSEHEVSEATLSELKEWHNQQKFDALLKAAKAVVDVDNGVGNGPMRGPLEALRETITLIEGRKE